MPRNLKSTWNAKDGMQPALTLRKKIFANELTTGLLATDHLWTDLVEVSARAGLDYLIVDLEHGPHPSDLVAEVCATGRRMDFPVLIRPRTNDYATLRHALDMGACGFLLASVGSTSELDVVRDALCVPPRGHRRPGGPGNRWVPEFLGESWRTQVEEPFIVLPQIETLQGMELAEQIARHAVTTALAVGPYDLSAELGVCGQMQAPILKQALQKLLAVAKAANKPMWMIGGNVAELVREGFRFLCIGEPTYVLEGALKERLAQGKSAL